MNAIRHLEPLLEPQERLNRLIAATMRRWGPKVADFSYANVHAGPAEDVLRALELSIRDHRPFAYQYTPYGGRITARRTIASNVGAEEGLPLTYRDVVMTPGAMAALNIVLRTLFGAGDELILLTPCWQDYPLYARNLSIPVCTVPLAPDKHLDLDAIGRALSRRTRALLMSHPGCPTGVCYRADELDALARLLRDAETRFGTRIYLISDEVHRRFVWHPERPFVSALGIYPRSLVIYSFGKTLALQGQRIGYVAVSSKMRERAELRQALERCVRLMGFCAPTELMQHSICRLLDYRPPLGVLAAQQEMVRGHLTACGYDVCNADATFFVYVKCPIADDFQFAASLASHGVLVVPSTLFHEPGYFRVCLTGHQRAVAAALPVFARVRDEVANGGLPEPSPISSSGRTPAAVQEIG